MILQNWTPQMILQLSGDYWKSFALHAGTKLDLFTLIGDDLVPASHIATKIEVDGRAVTMLLNALTAMQLLIHTPEGYANTPSARLFLSRDSDHYLGHLILHHHYLADSWSRLDRAIQTGKPQRRRSMKLDAARRESFLMGMFNIAMRVAPKIVAAVDLSKCGHLLDLGGGPGTYAIHFCMANPRLRATVYDRPEARPFAEKKITAFGLVDRIVFEHGDYLKKKLTGSYDAVLLSHILHAEGPRDCRKLIRKAISVVQPGGLIMIHEFILNDTLDGPLHPALFSLNMLLGTASGQSYSEKQLKDMLEEAGVRNVRRVSVKTPNDSGLIVGYI
jgi:predicted O-methyltransferase YrrM